MAAPKHANIGVSFGDNDTQVSIDVDNFSSLTLERVVSDSANHFTLNVLDDSAFDIEKYLLQGKNNIDVHYYDKDNNISNNFSGNITKMSSSFINNRNMLTLEGYVGLSIESKYQLYSRSWNNVVLFNWSEIFDDWVESDDGDGSYRTNAEAFWNNFFGLFENAFGGDYSEKEDIERANSNYINKALSVLDNIYRDDNGTFYTFSQKKGEEDKVVKGEEIILPVRPHKILKLLSHGGSMIELLESPLNKDSYEGCEQFIDILENRKNILVDFAFIEGWLKKYEDIKGNGWNYYDENIAPTKLVSVSLSQESMSDIKYIYEVLSKNSVKETKNNTIEYNYKFSIDENKNVHFKPIEISATQEPKKTYTYYGSFNTDDEQSIMTSFSADTNILTAYLTGDMSSLEDMSNLNLVTNSEMESDILSRQEDQIYSKESKYKFEFKSHAFAPKVMTNGAENAKSSWESYWSSAMSQVYKAKATILGNSGLAPGDYVEILVIPRPGLYHHSSGLYYIIKQTDKIDNGKMTSELELIKNIATLGQSSLNTSSSENNAGFGGGDGGGGRF